MKMKKQIVALSLLLAGLSHNALADSGDVPITEASKTAVSEKREAEIDKEGAKQHARIKKGVNKGQLTEEEAVALEAQHKDIQAHEAIAKSDGGKISAKDERHIKSEQKYARKKIYSATHNSETNPKK
jgi:hypothetical protein